MSNLPSNIIPLFGQSTSQTSMEYSSQDDYTGFGIDEIISVTHLQQLLSKLNEVFKDAKKANWDGEKAEPISDATYYNATRLLSVIPVSLPLPDILPDNDGYIEFEWYSSGKSFSLYVTDTNLILYAGFYGKDDRLSGRFNFESNFPDRVELLAKDIFKEKTQ